MNVQSDVNPRPAVENQWPAGTEWPARRLLNQAQTAAYLGVCGRTVYALAKKGKLKRVLIGRAIRYDLLELVGLISDGKKN